jgi:hypothetical protein
MCHVRDVAIRATAYVPRVGAAQKLAEQPCNRLLRAGQTLPVQEPPTVLVGRPSAEEDFVDFGAAPLEVLGHSQILRVLLAEQAASVLLGLLGALKFLAVRTGKPVLGRLTVRSEHPGSARAGFDHAPGNGRRTEQDLLGSVERGEPPALLAAASM